MAHWPCGLAMHMVTWWSRQQDALSGPMKQHTPAIPSSPGRLVAPMSSTRRSAREGSMPSICTRISVFRRRIDSCSPGTGVDGTVPSGHQQGSKQALVENCAACPQRSNSRAQPGAAQCCKETAGQRTIRLAGGEQGVHFIDEDDRGRHMGCHRKQRTHLGACHGRWRQAVWSGQRQQQAKSKA